MLLCLLINLQIVPIGEFAPKTVRLNGGHKGAMGCCGILQGAQNLIELNSWGQSILCRKNF